MRAAAASITLGRTPTATSAEAAAQVSPAAMSTRKVADWGGLRVQTAAPSAFAVAWSTAVKVSSPARLRLSVSVAPAGAPCTVNVVLAP